MAGGRAGILAARVATSSFTPILRPLVQRACGCGGSPDHGRECEECGESRKSLRRTTRQPGFSVAGADRVPPIVHNVLHSRGQPLDASIRAFMEPRFGHDFSSVRIHTGARAAESAAAVNALAYTVGRDVVFGQGRYSPFTPGGSSLLAHELTHVVQQESAPASVQESLTVGTFDDPAEREAAAMADLVSAGASIPLVTADHSADWLRRSSGESPSNTADTETPKQEGKNSSEGTTESGGLCLRTPFPPGQVLFEGSEEQVSTYRVIPEEGDQPVQPVADTWYDADGVWSKDHVPANEWFKVPSHCDATLHCTGQDFTWSACCNAVASLFKGEPRWVTDDHDAMKNMPR